mgnify:CR=1 FL=1
MKRILFKIIIDNNYQQSNKTIKMPIQIIHRDEATERLQRAASDKKRGEICMFYHREAEDICFNNKEFVEVDMKNWRKSRKQGKVRMLEGNNRDCKINGRQYYVLVLQSANGLFGIDPTGMGWDDTNFGVDGYIYYFQKKVNRDMVFNYVMGIK